MKVVLRLKFDVREMNILGFFLFFVDCGSWYDILKLLKNIKKWNRLKIMKNIISVISIYSVIVVFVIINMDIVL